MRADVSVNLNVKDAVKAEWEGLRRHDVCFLVTVKPPVAATSLTYDYMVRLLQISFVDGVSRSNENNCITGGLYQPNWLGLRPRV